MRVTIASVVMVPIEAVKVWVVFPAGTTMLAGTVTRAEFELSVSVVSADAGCDRVTVQGTPLPDVMVPEEHVIPLTKILGSSWIAADAEDPL